MTSTMWGQTVTEYFYSLTPDVILNAIEAKGFRCTGRCFQLNSMENRVYQIEVESEEQESEFVIAKFYRPGRWSKEQIQEEHDYLQDLVSVDIPAVAPIASNDGDTVFLDESSQILFSLFPRIGGRNPDELSLETWPVIGRLIARMHSVGKRREAIHRPRFTPETYVEGALKILIEQGHLPSHLRERYEACVKRLLDCSAPVLEQLPYHRIHGDAHLGNLLHGREGYFWVDFDDMMTGPAVQDLWLILPGTAEDCPQVLDAFIEGYEDMQEFPYHSLRMIESLRAYRMLHYVGWIARRKDDPYFQRAFPDFGSVSYWERHYHDFNEQVILAVDHLEQPAHL